MKTQKIGRTDLEVTRIAYGCMNIGGGWGDEPLTDANRQSALNALHAALDAGIDFFDHADIYCRGKSEQVFADLWVKSPSLRQKVILQSKCGIRFSGDPNPDSPGRYDFSQQYIIASVEGSLERLKTDHLDLLLLHRPDPLVEPEEVAQAFDALHASGKVRFFGVSNHTAAQIALLQKHLTQPLQVNQVEFNLIHLHLLEEGVSFNQKQPDLTRNEGTLEYCRAQGITLQAWSPLALGRLSGSGTGKLSGKLATTAALVTRLALEKGVTSEAILLAWILRHPMHIQPVIGTIKPERIHAACEGDRLELSREEWYQLFVAARGAEMP